MASTMEGVRRLGVRLLHDVQLLVRTKVSCRLAGSMTAP